MPLWTCNAMPEQKNCPSVWALYKILNLQARAYFELFRNQAFDGSSFWIINYEPKFRPGPLSPSLGSLHPSLKSLPANTGQLLLQLFGCSRDLAVKFSNDWKNLDSSLFNRVTGWHECAKAGLVRTYQSNLIYRQEKGQQLGQNPSLFNRVASKPTNWPSKHNLGPA